MPDNKGIAWFSPVWGTTTEHVIGAWQIYQHTGDVDFLHECYDDYFKLLFKDGMHGHWGCHYDAAEHLREMAILTGDPEDPNRWLKLVHLDQRDHWLNNMWEKHQPDFFGGSDKKLDWSDFAYLRNSYFPEEWAYRMTAHWAMDSQKGFFWEIPLSTAALKDFDQISDVFASTPDTNYYAILRHVQLPRGAQRQPDRPGSFEEVQHALGHPDRARGLEQAAGAVGRPVFQFQRRQDPVDPGRYGRPGVLDPPKHAYRMRQHARRVEFHGIADSDEGRRPNVLAQSALPTQRARRHRAEDDLRERQPADASEDSAVARRRHACTPLRPAMRPRIRAAITSAIVSRINRMHL